ncbi:MAG: DinB family protein [Chloroflexi bacterium]|nr:DinB family protein [Chloroflexota bacterium]
MTPEERRQRIAAYGAAHSVLVKALEQFPRTMWQFRPAPDRWTIHEIVVHITDSETNSFIRCRRAIAEPGSGIYAYDEMRWARELDYHGQSPDDALELFKWLRLTTHKLIATLPDEAWSRTFVHSDNGVVTLEQWLDTYERHVRDHVAQMQGVYAAWLKRKPA